jgi:NADPH2:quinone reductase
MRAVVCRSFDEPEQLVIEERGTEPCGADRVRVRVWASGVNFVDALIVQGRYQIKPPVPFVPGSELAGEVTEVGTGVEGWSVGDRVMASVGLGGFVDEIVLHPDRLTRIPDALSFGQAATMGQSYLTAWFTLTRRTALRPDEWVVTFGGAGGVGLAVLDVARALGANTVAAASSAEKLQLCIERGAHAVVDLSADVDEVGSVRERIRAITGGGADVVVDPVGGALAEEGLRSLGDDGRLMVVGFASGEIPRLPANQVLLRNRRVIGVDWGGWALAHGDENAAMANEVLDAIGDGRLVPVEPAVHPLTDVGAVLRDLLERRIVGKVCLESR